MFKIKKITIIILLCLSSNIVNSESNLSQILVSPGQKGTAIFDSLTSIEVITSEDIRAFGYSTVDEVLSNSSSINIGSNGGYGQTKSIFMRGTESNHTKVLINGVEIEKQRVDLLNVWYVVPLFCLTTKPMGASNDHL